jgi:Glycosyl transferase family group 2
VIAVVDSDYQVDPTWLSSLVGYFDDATVAVVQTPQAHREWGGHLFRTMMNWEYDGFFRIGMHHRNERNAIVQHGTMTMIRAQALRQHGAWSAWCVCEDTELGLRLMQQGLSTVYVDQIFGRGLTPDGFAAFKKQRYRWAQGGMQIFKAHCASLLRSGQLSGGQRYHFLAGWLPWLGDALHLVFALAAVAWTVGALLLPAVVSLPNVLFMLPLATFVLAKLVIGPLLYWRRVPCSLAEIVGASIAGMAVSHGIARGVIAGLFGRNARFEVTDKGTTAPRLKRGMWVAVREEALMFALLAGAACSLVIASSLAPATSAGLSLDRSLWIAMLILQILPYAAALGCMWLSTRPASSAIALDRVLPRA